MNISQKYLLEIVERSSTIFERLGTEFLPDDRTTDNDNAVDSRIKSWCEVVAKGKQEQFEKRLAWDGLDLNSIRQIVGSVRLADKEKLPAWVETLKAALQIATSVSLATLEKDLLQQNRCLNPLAPLPFEELLLPFINVARQQLSDRAGFRYYLLSQQPQATLERCLLKSLTYLCSQAMGVKFQVFRTYEQPTLIRSLGQIQGAHSRVQYDKFVRRMLEGGLLEFFQEYPVLARLSATVTDFWVNSTSEFLHRLASDWSEIQTTFHREAELAEVIEIQPGLSDPHQEGRSVIALSFASGLKLIYKPKDLGIEEAYFELLGWLNERNVPLPFKQLKVLNRSTHGWVEYVEHLPCPDKQAAQRYYQRAGMLLCLLYVLEGTDCHCENIIACEEHPVSIDMEMLMSHRVREVEDRGFETGASYLASQQFNNSLLRTCLLPQWQSGQDGLVYDISGLGGVGGQKTHIRMLKWQHVNTDGMILGYEDAQTRPQANIPILDGIGLSASDYVEELVDGFRQMYQFFTVHKEELVAPNGPLARLARQKVRFVFRPTQVYGSVLKETLQPKLLKNGADRSIALDVLCKSFLSSETKPLFWPILEAEKQALAQLDIPLFNAFSDRDDLKIAPNQTIENYFTEPSYSLVLSRLQKLNENDLEQQISFIRSSLYTGAVSKGDRTLLPEQLALNFNAVSTLPQEVLVQQAVKIARELRQRSVRGTDGSVTWMGLEYIPRAQRFQFQPMSYDLYDGSYGLALFFAALKKVTGEAEFRDLALAALQPFSKLLQDSDIEFRQKIAKQMGIGGGKGLGSIIYALVRISQFLEEPVFLKDAQQVASLITPAAIAGDRKFDIISGSAGAILGLLSLYQTTAKSAVLELAIKCGEHLVNNRTMSDSGFKAWATLEGKLLTGFSHGGAGIAYALLRLYAVTKESTFLQVAEEAIAYERSVFSPAARNWPDFRGEKPGFANNWCNGAPGIGLARLGGLAILDSKEIRQEIEIALETTQKYCLQDIDHLCCGNFGRIDVLLVAAKKLSRSEFLETAQKYAAWAVAKADKTESFQLFSSVLTGTYNPGLFQGMAGIGYELLRLADPDLLPSVLLWE